MKLVCNGFALLSVMLGVLTVGMVGHLFAQTSQGRILGTVTDQTGAVVAGAKVTIRNIATNTSRSLVSNSAGEYFAAALDPGTYQISAESSGFKKSESTPALLEVSREIRVDLKLQPGAASQTMEVVAQETLVDTTDTTLNGVLSNRAINELPLQGRDFQNLLPLHPGVQRSPGGGFHSVTSNGNRPDDNNFYIDGADDNDVYYGETVINDAGISGTPASILPLDSIQEFNTQESPSADYGVKPGVVTNIGIKSGTNAIHGTAYYFHRNAALDARNYFNPAPRPISSLLLHQFGASLGGAIKKDKWFYFLNYEGIRDKVGNPAIFDTPVTESLMGRVDPDTAKEFSIVDAVAACQSAGTCNPLSLNLAGFGSGAGVLPANPGLTASQSDPAAIFTSFNNKNRGDNLVGKSDYSFNEHHRVSARFIYSNTDQTEEDVSPVRPEWLTVASPRTQVFGINWTWTPNSAWINDAHFSYNRFNEALEPADHNVNPSAYGLNTGVTDPKRFGFPRISPGSDFNYLGGNSSWPLDTTPTQTENFSDTVSFTRAKHSIRFGGSYRYGSVNYFRASYGRGRVDFSTLTDFVEGSVRRWRFLYGEPGRDISLKSLGFFFQDGYRINPRVTLNLGLRYDLTGPIKDSRNLLANYVPTSSTGLVQVGHGIDSPYPTNYNNISPRIGLAWDIFGTGKTVLRAGGGLIYEQPSIRTFLFSGGGLNLNPSGLVGNGDLTTFLHVSSNSSGIDWSTTGPIFPAAAGDGCSIDSQCDVFGVDRNLRTPYVATWNLNLQQDLGFGTVLQAAYVANNGIKLYSVSDINQNNYANDLEGDEVSGRPLVTNCPASVTPSGLGTGGPCFPYIGFLNFLSNKANSNYNSLQVTLTKHFSHGLYLLAGYTYAHAIDTATSNLAGVPQNSFDYAAERGNGDNDIRHRFTISTTYQLPSVKSKLQMLEGWQVTTLATIESALPYSLYDSSNDISGTGELADRWDFSGNPKDIHWSASGSTVVPFYDFTSPELSNSACLTQATALGTVDNLLYYGCYQSGSAVITPPSTGSFGNMGRNIFRGPGFVNWDFSASKIWKLRERWNLQLRGEFFNLLNHPNFPTPTANTDLSDPGSLSTVVYTPDVRASNPVIGSGGSRHIQLGAKLIW